MARHPLHSLVKDRWARISAVFDSVIGLTHAARGNRLQALCTGDSALRHAVERLLDADQIADGLIEQNVAAAAAALLQDSNDSQPVVDANRHIGPYTLKEEIGRGGMGLVYRAERSGAPFEQQVAIKLLPIWQNAGQLVERFRQEQRVLASLNHNNIARLYDGGLTDDGQPYIVMEYVDGEPITRYCRRRRLELADKIALISQVVDALTYAHRNLIVHRDVKPSNILVGPDGQIKLLDFGIAKLLDPDGSELTESGQRVMTPEFAAPEQVRGQPISVATDIYQIGIVCYELLTGRRPYRKSGGSVYEMARIVCEEQPLRPSVAIARDLDVAAKSTPTADPQYETSATQFVIATRLQKQLVGDLDAIVMKTLEKAPADRYASMEALDADLDAYRNGRPISARAPTIRYRAGKLMRRHRLAVAAASVFIVMLVVYAMTVTIQANRIQSALAQSEIETRKAQQVSGFLIDIFAHADPNVAGGDIVTARELLDRSQDRIRGQLDDAPQIEAQMLHMLGTVYFNLGLYDDSLRLLEDAVSAGRRLAPAVDDSLASSLTQLGIAYSTTDRLDEAQALLEEALERHTIRNSDSIEVAETHNALGVVLRTQGDGELAERHYNEAIARLRRLTDGYHSELAVALNNLAALQRVQGRLTEAEANMRASVNIQERTLGVDHSYFTVYLKNLAGILMDLEQFAEAEPLFQQALDIQQRLLGVEHPYYADTLGALGLLHYRQGNLALAESLLQQALDRHRDLYGNVHRATASVLYRLGRVYEAKGAPEEAASRYRQMLEIDQQIFSPDSAKVGRDLGTIASLAMSMGDYSRAEKLYEQSLAKQSEASVVASNAQIDYARLLLINGDARRAEQLARLALANRQRVLPPGHSAVAEARSTLGIVLAQTGQRDSALAYLQAAQRVLERHRRGDDAYLIQTRVALDALD